MTRAVADLRTTGVTTLVASMSFVWPLLAEGGEPSVVDTSGVIEEVVVTGTWIPGTPEDDPLPVTRIDRDTLTAEGSPSVVELVRNLSFSLSARVPTASRTNTVPAPGRIARR